VIMFYQGDLQSGINAAVQQSKLVACFVGGELSDKAASLIVTKANMCQITKKKVQSGRMIFYKRQLWEHFIS
jgi:hypothetical protein